ncbi:peptidylprolyl isomerase [Xanthobacter autotrophicus DSM 431]|uniref:peptidylprolyl isomerase n=1 Tax=Xanthobacter nonsaccharivorans TaxID=3119912 RepID=UPI00372B0D69
MTEIIGTSSSPRPLQRPDEVRVDGVVIPRSAIAREIQHHSAKTPVDAWRAAARALVVRELLLAEARRLGIDPKPATDADGTRETDEEALIRALLEREVMVPNADTATCRRYFERNRTAFRSDDLYEVSHILIPAPATDETRRSAARAEAEAVLRCLISDGAAFEDMARAHSACPSRDVGGSLGQIGPGQTAPEFEAALPAIVPGPVHPELVSTRYGFHIVRVAQRIAGAEMPFEAAEAAIAAHLEVTSWHIAVRQYLSLLAGKADIRGVTLEGAATPLVQ